MLFSWFRGTSGKTAVVSAVAAASLLSCGDGDKPSSPDVGTNPDVVQIRGGERLGWWQAAVSVEELRAHGFRLFVDGAESSLADTQCADAASPSGYLCSGRLPGMPAGTHTLELAAVFNGQQSTRSSPLRVMVLASSGASSGRTPAQGPDAGAGGAATIAAGLRRVSFLTTVPDGRLLFVENDRAIRVIEADGLRPEPAYAVDGSGAAIVGVAIDPRFAETRAVYVAWTETGRDGGRELGVTRFRELGNSLGQGATIVSGVPVPAAAVAPMGVDDDGLLYVAVPALAAGRPRADSAYSGFVLRFASDGSVPRANPRASPIVAMGFAEPRALAIDRAARRVWIAGRHPSWPHSVASFAIDAGERSRWPQLPRGGLPPDADRAGDAVFALSIAASPLPGGRPSALGSEPPAVGGARLDLVSPRGARRGRPMADGSIAAVHALEAGSFQSISAVVTHGDGHAYAAVGAATGPWSIVRLTTR